LLPSVGAHLGLPGCADDHIGLPAARRYVVLLADGLGWEILLRALTEAPTLADWLPEAVPLTVGVPSTTATSLASFGTGLPPGRHGVIGYRFWDRAFKSYVAPLAWDAATNPRLLQSEPTLFERAAAAGTAASLVIPEFLAESGFSAAAFRSPAAFGYDEADLAGWTAAVAAAAQAPAALVYTYDRSLDRAGHAVGVGSDAWREALARFDTAAAALREALDDEVVLLITGDHGMVDVPAGRRLFIEETPELAADLDHVGGEARFRHLYTRRPAAVTARWTARLGESAWVLPQAEAIERGWFGPAGPAARRRLGDVIVAVRDDFALLTKTMPFEARLTGMHGSLTSQEMLVPLFRVA
jgi:hypothetical protein